MGMIIAQLIIIFVLGVFGWAIRFKKAYWLISGFAGRSDEEQKQLIKNGAPQITGTLLLSVAGLMLILLPLSFTSFTYADEVQFGTMLFLLMGGMVYLSKYEVPNKRKRSYIISISLFVVVIGVVTGLYTYTSQPYDLVIKKDRFEVTGMYGDEWALEGVKQVKLIEEMPEVLSKSNGVGLSTLAKGYFNVKDYGNCLLFIHKNKSPYIYIELEKEKIFINANEPSKTAEWYKKLQAFVSKGA